MTGNILMDPYSQDVIEKGPTAYVELGRQHPVYHYQGQVFDFHIVSDTAVIREMLHDHERWPYGLGTGPKAAGAQANTGIMTDPPYHHEVRHIIQRAMSPRQLKRIAGDIDQLTDELIDTMLAEPAGKGDFFELFAKPLPSRLMCRMIGVPEEDYQQCKAWADEMIFRSMNDPAVDSQFEVAQQFMGYFFKYVNERRAMLKAAGVETPTIEHVGTIVPDDFLSRFICDRLEGLPLTDAEILMLTSAVLLGGNETTMNLMTNLLYRVLETPSLWEALKADPSLIPAAIEESLRLDPPVLGMCRSAGSDLDVLGTPIAKHKKVMFNISAANRDPAIWDNPDEFRLDRPASAANAHFSFGGGPHLCLGFRLARMELRQVFEQLVERLPNLRLDGEPVRIRGFNFWGRVHLPVAWN